MSKLYVLSVGGSILAPQGVDAKFLKKFRLFILNQIKLGHRFIIIAGGGQTCREYQQGLRGAVPSVTSNEVDWVGIYTTRLNAQLVRLLLGRLAHPHIIDDPNKKVAFKEKVLVAGGWKPGRSTDDDAVRLAKVYGASTIINLSNIDYVYNKDPRKFKMAKKIEKLSWKEFSKQFGSKWEPGLHAPFDPIAARFAAKNNQKVIVANGTDLKNLKNILSNKKFKGTLLG